MPVWLTWALIRRVAPWVLIAALAGLLLLDAEKLKARDATIAACTAARAQLVADVRAKTAEAQAADLANKQRVEAAQSTITEKTNATLEAALADARARAADYARRLRDQPQADRGGGGAAAVSIAPDAAGAADGAGAASIVATDATACAKP